MRSNKAKTRTPEKPIFTLMPYIEDEERRMEMIERMLDIFGIPREEAKESESKKQQG